MLLLVELKFNMGSMSDDRRSDIISQTCAEADGTSSSFQPFPYLILRVIYIQCHKKSTYSGYFDRSSRMGIFLFDFSQMYLFRGQTFQHSWISHRGSETTYPTRFRGMLRILSVSEDWYVLLVFISGSDH
jgi:hypothetical protein